MPDLTIHTARACSQTREWSREFPSSDGKSSYTVTWERDYSPDRVMEYHYTCTCWPWKKTGTCKHAAACYRADISDNQGPDDRCGWDDRMHHVHIPDDHDETLCPLCGSDTIVYQYGA